MIDAHFNWAFEFESIQSNRACVVLLLVIEMSMLLLLLLLFFGQRCVLTQVNCVHWQMGACVQMQRLQQLEVQWLIGTWSIDDDDGVPVIVFMFLLLPLYHCFDAFWLSNWLVHSTLMATISLSLSFLLTLITCAFEFICLGTAAAD